MLSLNWLQSLCFITQSLSICTSLQLVLDRHSVLPFTYRILLSHLDLRTCCATGCFSYCCRITYPETGTWTYIHYRSHEPNKLPINQPAITPTGPNKKPPILAPNAAYLPPSCSNAFRVTSFHRTFLKIPRPFFPNQFFQWGTFSPAVFFNLIFCNGNSFTYLFMTIKYCADIL